MQNLQENFYNAKKRQLNLSHRYMRYLDEDIVKTFAPSTEYLDLSHNFIHNMTWIYEFHRLNCLIMDNNRLRETHFESLRQPLPKIHTLMLNKNEMSDLEATADVLQRLFPNVKYLSLHGNAMCPDGLFLQPFCEFVPYEYSHYRTVLSKSLPHLKFPDHSPLDWSQRQASTQMQIHESQKQQQLQQQRPHYKQFLTSIRPNLWFKRKPNFSRCCDFSNNENLSCAK